MSTVRFDHPPVNALDLDLLDDVIATMRGLDGPVVITGAGRCFSAGVDLPAIVEGGAEYTDRFMTSLSAAFLAVFDHPAPVVAAINGHAIAGGCVLRDGRRHPADVGGDDRADRTRRRRDVPDGRLEICRYAMGSVGDTRGPAGAGTVDVSTAAALGWVDEVVTADELLPRSIALARELVRVRPCRLRDDEGTAAPAGPRGDRCGRGDRRGGARRLDVGRDPCPDGRVHERRFIKSVD